jgi:pyruvate carboxylase
MYPKVFTNFSAIQTQYGPVEKIPKPIYFYRMEPGQESTIELDAGVELDLRCLDIDAADDAGLVRVFFELNGQVRQINLPNKRLASDVPTQARADPDNPKHVPAPMPGLVSTVAVRAGQNVSAGDVLVVIEAMKMETAIRAEPYSVIGRVVAPAGTQVDSKDLLIEFE